MKLSGDPVQVLLNELECIMSSLSKKKAEYFLNNEKEFHLGALPTEQSHPKTKHLSQTAEKDTAAAVRLIQSVDQDIPPAMERVFAQDVFHRLVETIPSTLENGGKIYFTGCGATGRLAILLEAVWRRFWQEFKCHHPELTGQLPDLEDRVISVMTGGDHALIRSVEGYEDYTSFGSYHLEQAGVRAGDLVVATTEGGETSFVIGTAGKGLDAGAKVFFAYNNPSDVLAKHVKRSREVIEEPRIGKLDLATGPMAVAGSTRMQATTSELLAIGTALEMGLRKVLGKYLDDVAIESLGFSAVDAQIYVKRFRDLLDDLNSSEAVKAISQMVEFEETVYRENGLVTYMADEYMLDILTDTTERTPTFRLPPFRKCDDTTSPRSWAFIKKPTLPTAEAWLHMMRRPLRGIDWNEAVYRQLGASEEIQRNHPRLGNAEIVKFQIGNEDDSSRYDAADSAAVMVLVGSEISHLHPDHPFRKGFAKLAEHYRRKAVLYIGSEKVASAGCDSLFRVPCRLADSPLSLWNRLAIKLVLNTVSTATMARMGRLDGNLMAYVETSNKKLIDRATRLISELAQVSYEDACYALFDTFENLDQYKKMNDGLPSSVQITVGRIKTGACKK
jgi:N-acetylmuramic acid 6-phosphate etherase